jgi:hypothetical protein
VTPEGQRRFDARFPTWADLRNHLVLDHLQDREIIEASEPDEDGWPRRRKAEALHDSLHKTVPR